MPSRYGRFISIDLSSGGVERFDVDPADLKLYLGGGGIGAKLFIDGNDDEALVIANGLLTGFPVPTACKTSLLFRSPLTGVLGESSVGGKF
ncbi:MAG: aldehyde ferredoxin oxidoreductase N-terminal domain-containing protein, partial [Candidatus Alcyoniella australis]|nr:aldehyde ferredoxin oxidoreductase N-terminal domain-containing protein [Candidatus Alcyoniella australis]